MSDRVSWVGMAMSVAMVVVALAVSWSRRLGLEGSIAWAALRAAVQLVAVGLVLTVLLDPQVALGWSWLWIVVMVGFAAFVVQRRARDVPDLYALALAAFGAAAAVTLGVLFGLGVFDLEARTLVPMAGLVIGNSMTAAVLVARRLFESFRDERALVEARLALGYSSADAARPSVRAALRTALVPQIESTKAVGLVFLPGAMTGLILAGAEPLDAVRVQVAVMYLVLGSVATTTAVIALGVSRRMFTRDHRLVRVPSAAS